MIKKSTNLILAGFVFLLLIIKTSTSSAAHPSLFFTSSDVADLQAKIAISGSRSKQAFDALNTSMADWDESYDANCENYSRDIHVWAHDLIELALKFAISGNSTYGYRTVASVNSIITHIDPGTYEPCNMWPPAGPGLITHGSYVWPVAVAYDFVYPYMTNSERDEVRNWLAGMCHWLWENLGNGTKSYENFYINGWAALALTCFTLKDDVSDTDITGNYFNTSTSKVQSWLNIYYHGGGYPYESSGYAQIGGPPTLLYAYARIKNEYSDIMRTRNIYKLPKYAGYARLAHGRLPDTADGNWYSSLRMTGFNLIMINDKKDSVERWFWDHSTPSIANEWPTYNPKFYIALFYPEDISSQHPHDAGRPDSYFAKDKSTYGGIVAFRSGWDLTGCGTDTVTASFHNTYTSVNHEHYAMNNFEMSAYGEHFAIDKRMEGYDSQDHGTCLEHNVIIVDDTSMPGTQSGTGGTLADGSSLGRIFGFTSGDGGSICRGDAKYPYIDRTLLAVQLGKQAYQITEADIDNSGGPFDQADRIFAMVNGGNNPSYIAIVDEIKEDSGSHKYEFRLHSERSISGQGSIANPFIVIGDNADLYISFVQPEAFTGSVGTYSGDNPQEYHNMLSAVQNGVVTGHFFSLHYPRKTGQPAPSITRNAISGGVGCSVSWGGSGIDYLIEKRSGDYVSYNNVISEGRFATVRTASGGSTVGFLFLEGETLSFNGEVLVSISGGGSASASADGTIASVDAVGTSGFSIYAPTATTMLLNGSAISITRNGDYIVYGDGGPNPPDPGNYPPAVSITLPSDGATFSEPANISITATASDSDGSIDRVEFYSGTTLLGEDTTAPYSHTWQNVSRGNYQLSARAYDDSGEYTTSDPVEITVNSGESWYLSDDTWQDIPIAGQTGSLIIEFDIIPNAGDINAVTGLASGTASAYSDLACIVAFFSDGSIKARNGGMYDADTAVSYVPGTVYHFSLDVNISAHTYSVYVTPDGGSQIILATDYAFRTEQQNAASLDSVIIKADNGSHQTGHIEIKTPLLVDPSDELIEYDGVYFPNVSESLAQLNRFSTAALNSTEKDFDTNVAQTSSGITIRFTTASPTVKALFSLLNEVYGRGSEFDVYQDGQWYNNYIFSSGVSDILFTLDSVDPGNPVTYQIVLPSYADAGFTGLELEQGNPLLANPALAREKYAAIGDSITQGVGGGSSSYNAYPYLLAQKDNWEVFNLGISASRVSPAIGEMLAGESVDYVTILWGYNDWNMINDLIVYNNNYNQTLDSIRSGHPSVPIFCITPTYATSTTPTVNNGVSLDDYRNALANQVNNRRNSGDYNIFCIRGENITDAADIFDGVHLSIAGADRFASRLYSEIQNALLGKKELTVTAVSANSHDGNVPANTIDNNLGTRWSAEGDGQWIMFELEDRKMIKELSIAFYLGDVRRATIDIEVSEDAQNWTRVYSGQSSGTTVDQEVFDVADTEGTYVRIVGHGNSGGSLWNSITEVDIHGTDVPDDDSVTSTPGWQSFSIPSQDSVFAVEYDVVPNQNGMNGVIALSYAAPINWSDAACIVRFDSDGYFDVRNGSGYFADVQLAYTAGTSYHMRLDIDVRNHTYSVYVTPAGGSEIQIAANYAFRTEQQTATSLNYWGLKADIGTHTVSAFGLVNQVEIPVQAISASADDGNGAANAIDKDLTTRWSAEGDGQWLMCDLGSSFTIGSVSVAWFRGDARSADFELQVSSDGSSWATVYSGMSSGTRLDLENYDIRNAAARYVRVLGHCNTANMWNSITEIVIYGSEFDYLWP